MGFLFNLLCLFFIWFSMWFWSSLLWITFVLSEFHFLPFEVIGLYLFCSFNGGLKRLCACVTHQSTSPQQQPSQQFSDWQTSGRWRREVLCIYTGVRETCRLCIQGRYSSTLVMAAASFSETRIKICQTIRRIYHRTSYLHCHPRKTSDLSKTARTPRPTVKFFDRPVPRDCLRRQERYSVTNCISSHDLSSARKRNKP